MLGEEGAALQGSSHHLVWIPRYGISSVYTLSEVSLILAEQGTASPAQVYMHPQVITLSYVSDTIDAIIRSYYSCASSGIHKEWVVAL